MTPAARLKAAIEIVDEVVAAARAGGAAADVIVQRYFKARRYAGAKDRRAIRELAYEAIRRAGEVPASGRATLVGLARDRAELVPLFDGSVRGPAALTTGEPEAAAGVAPAWLASRLAETLGPNELPALLARAPLDLRANRLKTTREALLPELPDAQPTPFAPDGLRLPPDTQVSQLPAFLDGRVAVQDEGSQIVAAACGAEPGMTVIDLCAGAGGKTLALGAAMANRGRIVACDVDRPRLSRLAPRAELAGLTIAETRLLDGNREAHALADLAGAADLVIVDAPCSGTGTWRRNPEARWRLTPERLDRLIATQRRVLDLAATLVRPGGRLAYIVCSLLDEEGAGMVETFVAGTPGWTAITPDPGAGRPHDPGRRLTPGHDGTDGFFVAVLRRAC